MSHDSCYRALQSRDHRFDGRFFTGVTSTGVYCHPICPARTPKSTNCIFFRCAAAAEGAGFRPCRRCRPEAAPGSPAWNGTSATVSRAMRLVEQGALEEGSVADLAERLGVGGRHLRRLFMQHLGASPLAVARTRRAHLAQRLIVETRLSMANIAFASGYRSVRRFNAGVRQVFLRSPRELRQRAGALAQADDAPLVTLRHAYRAPLSWKTLLAFLKPRAIPGVESINASVYRRTVQEGDFVGTIQVEAAPADQGHHLLMGVPAAATPCIARLSSRVRRLFDLGADPNLISAQLGRDPLLREAVRAHPGLRVPGSWDPFETAIRAILGQQISVAGATRLAGKLVRAFGRKIGDPAQTSTAYLFPRPADLAGADIASIGMPCRRAEAIRALARAVAEGAPVLEIAPSLELSLERLTALSGVGDWTANYIAMRALGEPDAFPAGDLGLRKALTVGVRGQALQW